MPDFIKKTDHNGQLTNETDWNKIFMGFAMALVFIMQQYHAMQLADVKSNVVPRTEYEQRHQNQQNKTMDKDAILDAFRDFSKRLERLETEKREKKEEKKDNNEQ